MPLTTEELNDIIRKKVETWFNQSGQGLFLSTLGLDLSKNCHGFRELLDGRKLAEYIQTEMQDTVNIIEHSTNRLIKIVVPVQRGETTEGASEPELSVANEGIPRYKRGVWLAFTRPIIDGQKRVIKLVSSPFFKDVPSCDEVPEGFVAIANEKISQGERTASTVHKNIQAWLSENRLTPAIAEMGDTNEFEKNASGTSILERMLSVLNESELKRVQLPLDIVNKLLKA
ncbi:hypothetical protein D3C81_1415300 [compost metagenome]